MATNKIYFNSTTTPITLNGIYWNGTKIEGCKGINLNGTVVVSFDTVVIPRLDWTDYTTAYNDVNTGKMIEMTAQNEFAICRSAWMLYTRIELLQRANLAEGDHLFNFNADGRIYIDIDSASNWNKVIDSYSDPITITSPHSRIPIWAFNNISMLTGLPLIYKKEDTTFASTKILSHNDDNSYSVEYGEYWTIHLDDLSEIIDYNDTPLTSEIIATAIKDTLGVEAIAQDSAIEVTGSAGWGVFEFLDALSNVYVPGFGPFYVDDSKGLAPDEAYHLSPNANFRAQSYWSVNITNDIIIKNAWETTDPCDFYILTGWGLEFVNGKTGDYVVSGNYSLQGENNAEVNITYFDTSCFNGLKCPNILCSWNSVYSSSSGPVIADSNSGGPWAGVYNINDYGNGTPSSLFPTDCGSLFDVTLVHDVPLNIPTTVDTLDKWIDVNNLQDAKVSCELYPYPWEDQSHDDPDSGYQDNGDIIPSSIADAIFANYDFPSNDPSRPAKVITYGLRLKMRTYPSAASSDVSGDNHWYLNSYDPYNVGGYYPVAKTTSAQAGTMYKTTVNYTAQ